MCGAGAASWGQALQFGPSTTVGAKDQQCRFFFRRHCCQFVQRCTYTCVSFVIILLFELSFPCVFVFVGDPLQWLQSVCWTCVRHWWCPRGPPLLSSTQPKMNTWTCNQKSSSRFMLSAVKFCEIYLSGCPNVFAFVVDLSF